MLTQQRNLAILVTLQSTGLRVSELVALRRKNLNLAKQGAYVAAKPVLSRYTMKCYPKYKRILISGTTAS